MKNIKNTKINIIGSLTKYLYRDEYTGYSIFVLSIDDTKALDIVSQETIICKGNVPDYDYGTPINVEGIYIYNKEHNDYHIDVRRIEKISRNVALTASYLQKIDNSIDKDMAFKIANQYKDNLYDEVQNNQFLSDEMHELVPELSLINILSLIDKISASESVENVYSLLNNIGINNWQVSKKIANEYGNKACECLNNNPYIGLNYDLSFKDCDYLAYRKGIKYNDYRRIMAIIKMAFTFESSKGHMYCTESIICQLVEGFVKRNAYMQELIPTDSIISVLNSSDEFISEIDNKGYEAYYLNTQYDIEVKIAKEIKRLMDNAKKLNYDENIVNTIEKKNNITYADAQRKAFNLIKKTGVAILRGGPGTGKSTTLNGLIDALEMLNPGLNIILCSPTGRASQRMSECTNRKSSTLHKILEYHIYEGQLVHKDSSNQINADVIVVDESSMIDAEIASIFFSAIKNGSLVLLIGDVAQLPSVGYGAILNDLISSSCIPMVTLETIFRQGQESPIVINSKLITDGCTELVTNDEFQVKYCKNVLTVQKEVIDKFLSFYNCQNPYDTQILVPTKNGEAGITTLNSLIQNIVNPSSKEKKEVTFNNCKYRVNDKVIFTKNCNEYNYCNGEMGIISDISKDEIIIEVQGSNTITIPFDNLSDVQLGYAITVHKSQGSEFKNVIVSLPQTIFTTKNLLFTAVTRAKKNIVIVSEYGAIDSSINNIESLSRRTRLSDRIKGVL